MNRREMMLASFGGSLLCTGNAGAKETGFPLASGCIDLLEPTGLRNRSLQLKVIEFGAQNYVSNLKWLLDGINATHCISVFAWLPQPHAMAAPREVSNPLPPEVNSDSLYKTMLFWGKVRVTFYPRPFGMLIIAPTDFSHWEEIPKDWYHV